MSYFIVWVRISFTIIILNISFTDETFMASLDIINLSAIRGTTLLWAECEPAPWRALLQLNADSQPNLHYYNLFIRPQTVYSQTHEMISFIQISVVALLPSLNAKPLLESEREMKTNIKATFTQAQNPTWLHTELYRWLWEVPVFMWLFHMATKAFLQTYSRNVYSSKQIVLCWHNDLN